MGVDLNWASHPKATDDTWFAMNSAGVFFCRAAIYGGSFLEPGAFDHPGRNWPYLLEVDPVALEACIRTLDGILEKPDEPYLERLARIAPLAPDCPWRAKISSLRDYLVRARDEGGGVCCT